MPMNAEALLRDAERATGLNDWGGEEYFDREFRELLAALAYSLDHEAGLSAQGYRGANMRLRVALESRLQFIRDRAQDPALKQIRIERPMFIFGLPRSGSTFLQALLAQDPAVHAPLTWEMVMPSPPPALADRANDPRIARVDEMYEAMGLYTPQILVLHPFGARQPEECHLMMEIMLLGDSLPGSWKVPTFNKKRNEIGVGLGYRAHRMVLQNLHSTWQGTRVVLKNPGHLFYLRQLLEVYPDALLVQTHRDPAKVIPSVAALLGEMRKGASGEDPRLEKIALGNLRAFAAGVTDAQQFRNQSGREQQFFDVHFRTMIADPIGTVAGIYAHYDTVLTDAARAAMQRWLDDPASHAPKGKHALADYGLDAAAIDTAFGDYMAHYGVARER